MNDSSEETLRQRSSTKVQKRNKANDESSPGNKSESKSKKDKKGKNDNLMNSSSSSPTISDNPSSSSTKSSYDGFAWLFIFAPSLLYYLFLRPSGNTMKSQSGQLTQRGIFSHGTLSNPAISKAVHCSFSQCDGMSHLFSIVGKHAESRKPPRLRNAVQQIMSATPTDSVDIFRYLNHPLWIHDEELGRGYLLLSDVYSNRIWRWEVGGGPITIGRTLHMERSGCRSNPAHCDGSTKFIGSAGLAITNSVPSSKPSSSKNLISDGRLIISELGERRIIRVEEDGARTPLVKPVLAWDLLYVPTFQDLIYTTLSSIDFDSAASTFTSMSHSNNLYALRQVPKIPSIPASESRLAHFQNLTTHNNNLDIIYSGKSKDSKLSGIALSHDFHSLFVMEETVNSRFLIINVKLEEEEDITLQDSNDDNDLTDQVLKNNLKVPEDINKCKSTTFFDATHLLPADYQINNAAVPSPFTSGGIQVDQQGNVYVAMHPIGIIIINHAGDHVGTIPIHAGANNDDINNDDNEESNTQANFVADIITNLTFGEDHYLYVTTTTKVLRIKVKDGVKGMTMNAIQSKEHKSYAWVSRCSSSII